MPIESIKGRGATRNTTPTRFNLKERLTEGDWLDLPYDLPEASARCGLSQYELLTLLGRRFARTS